MNNGVHRFDHNGATLVDERFGVGVDRHIVFLHGWGANRESLRGIAVLFEATHAIHLIDLPGFGDAPPPPASWGTSDYADLVQSYLKEHVSGRIVLVGHSFGGRVSLRLAARRMEEVRGVVLMGTPGLPRPPFSRQALRLAGIRALRRVLRTVSAITGPGPLQWHTSRFGSKDFLAAGPLKEVFVRVVNEDLTDSARAVGCPVFLLWGAEDTEAPPSLAYRFRDLMNGNAALEVLPHKDHFLYQATGAHLCAFKIRGWLEHVA